MKPRLNSLRPWAALALLTCASLAAAQDEMPSVGTTPSDMKIPAPSGAPAAKPAKPTPAAAAPAAAASATPSSGGTNLLGDRDESPYGLTFIPWRESHAEKDIDRPARLLQEKPMPIDRTVFNRQVEYYEALAAELKKKGVVTPVAR